ncbi:alpha/beta hydrolase [Actinophytocola xinjiangensis]|uniref:Alpha/beta hydrolase n=1 Tax=Actinophytocola xinjiangensis TaxID=485602 RepID=A0A7Z1ATJ8_9PSEU|nr:alpha/beta hydrolase [Actinophytocola xinjiangensis]OLF04472.1 alpha/beta hydrolase [Actinophytocola xinjiangensis]
MRRELAGAGGLPLAVREAGSPGSPPIVLLHGWAASSTAWDAQFADPALTAAHRLIAPDLRGHGDSGIAPDGYDDPDVWAGDLAAVLAHAGEPAVVVGWSYGGLVITDYLRERGSAGIAGIVLVGAITEIGPGRPGGMVGPAMGTVLREVLSDDARVAVPALLSLVERMTAEPATGEQVQRRLADCLRVPASVRRALFHRNLGGDEVLERVDVPALVVHGEVDEVIDLASGWHAAGKIPGARRRWFPDVGHMPFAERVEEFDDVLRTFAGSVTNH